MARRDLLRPLDPVFDGTRRSGAVSAGNSPGVLIDYEYVLFNFVGGVIWYSAVDAQNAVVWPTLAAVQSGNLASETVGLGRIWFDAWYTESGYAPVTYAAGLPNLIWYAPADVLNLVP